MVERHYYFDMDYSMKKQLIQHYDEDLIKESQIVPMMQCSGRSDDKDMPMNFEQITITKPLIDRFRTETRKDWDEDHPKGEKNTNVN